MKFRILLVLVTIHISSTGFSQESLSIDQWRSDLTYLRDLIDEKYAHLYRQIPREHFHQLVASLDQKIPELEPHEIMVEFAKLVAAFKVGHSGIPLFQSMHGEALRTGFHTLPINFYQFSDGLFIQATTRQYASIVGAKVLEIGNKSAHEALNGIKPVVSLENESFFKAYGISMLSCPEILHAQGIIESVHEVRLLVESEGKVQEIFMPGDGQYFIPTEYGLVEDQNDWVSFREKDKTPLWLKSAERPYFFEYLKESKTVYVQQNQIRDGLGLSIAQFYDALFEFVDGHPVDRLILDIRQNGGGNNYLNKPIILGLIKSKVNENGKLITIIGRRTFSAAQNLVNELENYTEVTFIGEPTAENVNFFGDVNLEKLPNSGLTVRLSFMWWQDMDPRDHRNATFPEVHIELSSTDYRKNIDPVLEAALNYQNQVPRMLGKLREHLKANQAEEALQLAKAFIADPSNTLHISQLRAGINNMGYEHIKGNTSLAKSIFSLNTQLFPENANCWDSLAEAYLNANEYDKAVEFYEKAISIDPDGAIGNHARGMLHQIQMHSGN